MRFRCFCRRIFRSSTRTYDWIGKISNLLRLPRADTFLAQLVGSNPCDRIGEVKDQGGRRNEETQRAFNCLSSFERNGMRADCAAAAARARAMPSRVRPALKWILASVT